ncbi:MAG: flagellar biosynthetic protein FliO [Casimicrobiaceae bacterium]
MPSSAIARQVLRPTSTCAVLAIALALACAAARAASPGPVEPSFTGGLLQTLVGLGIVLALIWGAAWVMRRLNVGTQTAGSAIRVLASQALGQRERIVLVEIADQWLVLGVAPGSVNALSTLPKGTLPPRSTGPAPFAALLARARAGRADPGASTSEP